MTKVPTQIGRLAHIGWDMLGITLLLILCVELFSQAVLHVAGRSNTRYDFRVEADAYQNDAWPTDYYNEYLALRAHWEPYIYWQMAPFDGSLIGIDESGRRRTSRYADAGPRVFMFGGSTMWGIGARDAYTIPSYVASRLSERGVAAEILNYAEIGYVSTQEVLRLMMELRNGNIPDVVVFYDGVNDVTSAMYSGRAGIPQNEYRRRAEFNLLSRYRHGDLNKAVIHRWVATSATVRLARGVLHRFSRRGAAIADESPRDGDSDLIHEVASAYRQNIALVQNLADQYGFEALFYWQPVIFFKATLSPYEEIQLGASEKYRSFFESCYAAVARDASPVAAFHDISRCLERIDEPCFVDFMHVGEAANDYIAAEIAGDLIRLLPQ